MLTVDGGGGVDARVRDEEVRRPLQAISDKTFYRKFPELAPFDNGEGFWTAGLNRDVEVQEFEKYGRQILERSGKKNPGRDESFRAAAEKLLKILEGRGVDFARLYIGGVLEREVAAKVLQVGGSHFYISVLAKRFSAKGYGRSDLPTSDYGLPRSCREYNQVSWDGLGQFTFSSSSDTFYYPPEGGDPINACWVVTTTLDLNRETSPGRFYGEIGAATFARTQEGEKLHGSPWHLGEIGRYHTNDGASTLSAALYSGHPDFANYFGVQIGIGTPDGGSDYQDNRWRAGILASYLSIKGERNQW